MMTGLSFRLFRIPFRAQIWFFLTITLLWSNRLNGFTDAPLFVFVWFLTGIVIAGLSVVLHELGHCWAYRRYGQEPSVLLWGLGGLTFGQHHLPPKKSILVSVAGPLSTILLAALPVYLIERFMVTGPVFFGRLSSLPALMLHDIWFVTFIWALINLLPMLPLDGGHVVEAVLELRHGEPRKQTARLISTVTGIVAGLFALLVWQSGSLWLIAWILAGVNFVPYWQERNNSPVRYQLLPDEDGPSPFRPEAPERNVVSMDKARKKRDRRSPAELVRSGYEALERREYKSALRITDQLKDKRLNAELDRWAAEVAAFAWLGDRNPVKAEEVLGELPSSATVSQPLVAVLDVANRRTDDGVKRMVQSMVNEPEGGPKLIAVDLFAEYGMIHRLARDLVDQPGGKGFEAAVALEGMLHRLHRTQDASTVSDVIMLG